MTTFRGVEQKEVANSIREAASFIRNLDIGPETNKLMEALNDDSKLEKIENAATEADIYQAVNQSGVGILSRYTELLHNHAALNSNKKGYDTYYNLKHWGAFGPITLQLTDADVEEQNHVKSLKRNPIKFARITQFEFTKAAEKLTEANPFRRYGVVLDVPKAEFNKTAQNLHPTLQKILDRHYAVGAVRMSGMGIVGDFNAPVRKLGLMFEATEGVAQEVANEFKTYQVIDHKNRPVTPKP